MKNITSKQIKHCITLSTEKFKNIIIELSDIPITIDYTLEGIDIYTEDDTFGQVDMEEIKTKLADYFDVGEITSIHLDNNEYDMNVWLVYTEKDQSVPLYERARYHFVDEEAGYLQYNENTKTWTEYDTIPHRNATHKEVVRDADLYLPKGRYKIMFTDPMFYDVDTGEYLAEKDTAHMKADKIDKRFIVNYFAVNTISELREILNNILASDTPHGMWAWITDNDTIIYSEFFYKKNYEIIKKNINKCFDKM